MHDPGHVAKKYYQPFNAENLSDEDLKLKLNDKVESNNTIQKYIMHIGTPVNNKNTLDHMIAYNMT